MSDWYEIDGYTVSTVIENGVVNLIDLNNDLHAVTFNEDDDWEDVYEYANRVISAFLQDGDK